MYIQSLPSRKTEYGVITGTGKLAATFDSSARADEYRQKVDPSWEVVRITQSFTKVKPPKPKTKRVHSAHESYDLSGLLLVA